MRMIKAVIRPEKLYEVMRALEKEGTEDGEDYGSGNSGEGTRPNRKLYKFKL